MAMPLNLEDPVAVLLRVTDALKARGIEHATYGALALAAYGQPRETRDADLAVAGLEPKVALQALRDAGLNAHLAFERTRFGGLLITRVTLLPDGGATGLNTADLVEPRSSRFARGMLDRSLSGVLRGVSVQLVAPEDYVVLKVLSTRDRDLEDARSVLTSLPELDRAALQAEIDLLALEVPDHDVVKRYAKVVNGSD
ncbi:MAG: nucleotidyltransferase [Myxococcaceae bacterium]